MHPGTRRSSPIRSIPPCPAGLGARKSLCRHWQRKKQYRFLPLRLCDSAWLVMTITLTGKKKTQGLGDTRQSAALALAAPSADLQHGFEVQGVRRSVYQNARAPPSHPAMEIPECCNSGQPGRGGRVIADRVLPRSLLYRGLVVKTGLLGESPRLKTSSGTDSIRAGIVTVLRDSKHQMTLFLLEEPACSAARWLVPK